MIFVIDKPSGMTSHDVVSRLKKAFPEKVKIGHTGTLDPMCTGVLTVLTDNDTKLSDLLSGDKEYIATMRTGIITDTEDITGKVLEENDVNTVSEDKVKKAILSFTGQKNQLPPMYSSVKVGGKKLYELAREGKTVERKPRQITIYETEYLGRQKDGDFKFRISCSKGTYIRTVIADIGKELGCGACMTSLRRTRANGFTISDATELEKAEELARTEKISSIGKSSEFCFSFLGSCVIPQNGLTYFLNGGIIGTERLIKSQFDGDTARAYSESNDFLGLCLVADEYVKLIWKNI